ncbi:MAG TPA: 4Fe-4S dicluster domain-containing protein, partial [Thermoguttaceae bacterium]|nr:4Fe-4S dicluster domain-containing protein [Thermoguttaceae bacterium]
STGARRVIRVNKNIIEPVAPRKKNVRVRKLADYPHVSAAHRELAGKLSRPLLLGPPICDELIEFIEHTFTEEEADVARHLGGTSARSAAAIARAAHRPVDEIEPILQRMAHQRRTIACSGPTDRRRYKLMPIMPGIYELVLIGESPDSLTDWHRRFAELFERLYETGYLVDYHDRQRPMVRFFPLARALGTHPMALPSDRLEVVLDRYDTFGLGNCQCRTSGEVLGHGCGKPLEVCTLAGQFAELGIESGRLRRVSKKNILEIKREAESHALVTWVMNVDSAKGQASCSCCGCCCKAMRMVNEFNAPGMMAPPHFMPRFDRPSCSHCGRCAKACPMGAITVDVQNKTLDHQPARCIGCGLCSLACEREKSITMEPVPEFRLPYKSWFSMLLRNAPGMLKTAWKVKRGR